MTNRAKVVEAAMSTLIAWRYAPIAAPVKQEGYKRDLLPTYNRLLEELVERIVTTDDRSLRFANTRRFNELLTLSDPHEATCWSAFILRQPSLQLSLIRASLGDAYMRERRQFIQSRRGPTLSAAELEEILPRLFIPQPNAKDISTLTSMLPSQYWR